MLQLRREELVVMVGPFSFEPLAYAIDTISWSRAGLLLLATVIVLATLKSGLIWRNFLTRAPFALFVLLFAYLAVVIFSAQGGTPRFTFWQVVPSAVVMGSTTALAFLGWVYVEEEKPIDPIFTLISFVFFATVLSVVFSLVFVVMPRLIGSARTAIAIGGFMALTAAVLAVRHYAFGHRIVDGETKRPFTPAGALMWFLGFGVGGALFLVLGIVKHP